MSIQPDYIQIENVEEFMSWGKLDKKGNLSVNIRVNQDQMKEVYRPTYIEGLECTIDGKFRKNRSPLKVSFPVDTLGRKRRAVVKFKHNGKQTTFSAAKIVAQTWSPSAWFDDCYLRYKDGYKHNIHSDNLILVDEKEYFKEQGERNLAFKNVTFEQSRKSVNRMAKEAMLAKGFFDTGDFSEINRYVERQLCPELIEYALTKHSFTMGQIEYFLPELLGILYEHIYAYRPVANYTRFCRRLIREYRKNKTFGWYDRRQPSIIERQVNNLNIESLCKKFKETKIK